MGSTHRMTENDRWHEVVRYLGDPVPRVHAEQSIRESPTGGDRHRR